jgi:hypothetical protein
MKTKLYHYFLGEFGLKLSDFRLEELEKLLSEKAKEPSLEYQLMFDKRKRITRIMGNASEKFREKVNGGEDFVAMFMDQSLSEEDLMARYYEEEETKNLLYGFIATNWHLEGVGCYEDIYCKLVYEVPLMQGEFDAIKDEFQQNPELN